MKMADSAAGDLTRGSWEYTNNKSTYTAPHGKVTLVQCGKSEGKRKGSKSKKVREPSLESIGANCRRDCCFCCTIIVRIIRCILGCHAQSKGKDRGRILCDVVDGLVCLMEDLGQLFRFFLTCLLCSKKKKK